MTIRPLPWLSGGSAVVSTPTGGTVPSCARCAALEPTPHLPGDIHWRASGRVRSARRRSNRGSHSGRQHCQGPTNSSPSMADPHRVAVAEPRCRPRRLHAQRQGPLRKRSAFPPKRLSSCSSSGRIQPLRGPDRRCADGRRTLRRHPGGPDDSPWPFSRRGRVVVGVHVTRGPGQRTAGSASVMPSVCSRRSIASPDPVVSRVRCRPRAVAQRVLGWSPSRPGDRRFRRRLLRWAACGDSVTPVPAPRSVTSPRRADAWSRCRTRRCHRPAGRAAIRTHWFGMQRSTSFPVYQAALVGLRFSSTSPRRWSGIPSAVIP